MIVLKIPSLQEVKDAMYMSRSRFREHAEYLLKESHVFELALNSDVYRRLWGEKRYSPEPASLLEMPKLNSTFYATFDEKDPRIPSGPVMSGNEGWLCSTGSRKMKYFPFSPYDRDRLGVVCSKHNMIIGISPGDVFVNTGAEPPHCSLTMAQIVSDAYGTESVPVVRGMKPEEAMGKLMGNADKIVGITGVPLVTLRFLSGAAANIPRPFRQVFPKFRVAILGGENINKRQRDAFQRLGIECYEIYASAELFVPATECTEHDGLHLYGDDIVSYLRTEDEDGTKHNKFIWECQKGDIGELVVTTPNREAFPLVNYETNDVLEVLATECKCGITSPKVKIISRTDNVMNIGGAKAYEHHIERAFEELGKAHVIPDWQIHWTQENNGGVGYHRFDILIDNDALNQGDVRNALLEVLSKDKRTEQLLQANEAGILDIKVCPLPHKEYEQKAVAARHKRVRIVKKF